MKRHHAGDGGVAQEVAEEEFADAAMSPPSTKRPRSSPQLLLPPPAAPAAAPAATGGGGPITVWKPSPFALAKATDGEEDPMEAEQENGLCPLLGRRRSASLPPTLATAAGFLSPPPPPPFFATPRAPLPLPMPPISPVSPPHHLSDNSMAIVLYQPPLAERRLKNPCSPPVSASFSSVEAEKDRRRRRRAAAEEEEESNGAFERIEEEEEEGEAEAMMN